MIPELLAALAGFEDVQVVTDEGEPLDTWRAHRACLEAMPDAADALLVIQDDAILCEDFCAKATAAIKAKPDALLCLFVPGFGFIRRRMLEAQMRGERVTLLPQTAFVPLVATVYPRAIRDALLAWADGDGWPAASRRSLRGSDDGIVATFCRAARIHAWATVPCLVEHGDAVSLARPSHRPGDHRKAALL